MRRMFKWYNRGTVVPHRQLVRRITKYEAELKRVLRVVKTIEARVNQTGRASEHDLARVSKAHRQIAVLHRQILDERARFAEMGMVFYA